MAFLHPLKKVFLRVNGKKSCDFAPEKQGGLLLKAVEIRVRKNGGISRGYLGKFPQFHHCKNRWKSGKIVEI